MKALSEMKAAAAEAGQSVTGDYIREGSTIYRQGSDYLTVAKDGRVLSFVKNAIPNERVALKYAQLGGK